jgi:hypothetical protein
MVAMVAMVVTKKLYFLGMQVSLTILTVRYICIAQVAMVAMASTAVTQIMPGLLAMVAMVAMGAKWVAKRFFSEEMVISGLTSPPA